MLGDSEMKKFIVPIYLVLFLFLGGSALWYFGHHRPAQNAQNAAPRIVYKPVAPITQDTATAKQRSIEKHAHESPDETEVSTVMNQENTAKNPNGEEILPTDAAPSTPDNVANGGTASEHPQTHSREEIESENVEFKALMAEALRYKEHLAAGRERTQAIKDRKYPELILHLESKSPEEQRALLLQMKNYVYNEFPKTPSGSRMLRLSKDLDFVETSELLDIGWNSLLDTLAEYGYSPPPGVIE